MVTKIYMQKGWDYHSNILLNMKDELFYLIISYDEEQFYKHIRISFVKNEKNIYKIKGILCEMEHEDVTIGDFEYMIIDDSRNFELYEICFSEDLKEKIENVLEKGLEFIKEKQSESKLLDPVKRIKESKESLLKKSFKQLNEFLNILRDKKYD